MQDESHMDKSSSAYKRAVRQATAEYGSGSSIYRSGRIVTLYKQFGGIIEGPRHANKGLSRWFRERWVQVVPALERGAVVACGGQRLSSREGKACRPMNRISASTPITIAELLRLHPKADIIRAAKAKERDPEARLLWKTLTFC